MTSSILEISSFISIPQSQSIASQVYRGQNTHATAISLDLRALRERETTILRPEEHRNTVLVLQVHFKPLAFHLASYPSRFGQLRCDLKENDWASSHRLFLALV